MIFQVRPARLEAERFWSTKDTLAVGYGKFCSSGRESMESQTSVLFKNHRAWPSFEKEDELWFVLSSVLSAFHCGDLLWSFFPGIKRCSCALANSLRMG